MSHEADTWIGEQWIGKNVKQVTGSQDCIGRTGKVVDYFFDEKSALHCQVAPDNWWCPAAHLEIQVFTKERAIELLRYMLIHGKFRGHGAYTQGNRTVLDLGPWLYFSTHWAIGENTFQVFVRRNWDNNVVEFLHGDEKLLDEEFKRMNI